jgi:hypothetical protein
MTFELAGDLDLVPKHWKDEPSYLSPDEGSWFHTRAWSVGQIISFRESMFRLAEWARVAQQDASAPAAGTRDYAVMECYACHHELSNAASWRQQQVSLRPSGEPFWDPAGWAMLRPIVGLMAPDRANEFEKRVTVLMQSVSIHSADFPGIQNAALDLVPLCDELAGKANSTKFDRERTKNLLLSIVADHRRIAFSGYRAAVQAFLACDAMYRLAWAESGNRPENHDAAIASLAAMNDMLYADDGKTERSGTYDAAAFAELLKNFGAAITE